MIVMTGLTARSAKPSSIWLLVIFGLVSLTACEQSAQSVYTSKMTDFQVTIEANGELASADTAYLMTPVISGHWRHKLVQLEKEGKPVEKGQIVAQFEGNQINDKLQRKIDELATVKKELENMQIVQQKNAQDLKVQLAQKQMNYNKAQRKAALDTVTTSQIDSQKLRIDLDIATQELLLYQHKMDQAAATAELNLSIKQKEQQQLDTEVAKLTQYLAKLSIAAPKDGLLIYATNHEGQKFAVGDTLTIGQIFAEIPSLQSMIVKAMISEREVDRLTLGLPVVITLDADPQVKYQGKLVSLGAVIKEKARNNPEKVIEATIAIDSPALDKMRPGMIARLAIVVQTFKDVVVVPSQAVTRQGDKSVVWVKSQFGRQQREVTVLAFDENQTALSNGLAPDEQVLM